MATGPLTPSEPTCTVTVLMPVYNGAPHLREAIAAVLNQTLKSDWQFWIVDDGSNDDSWQVASEYARSDMPISLHRHQTNIGLYPTLNRWIPRLQSEYVAIVMQDDRLEPHYLEHMLELARHHPDVGAIWATYHMIDHNGRQFTPRSAASVQIDFGDGNRISLGSTNSGSDTGHVYLIPPGVPPWLSALEYFCFWLIPSSWTKVGLMSELRFREDLPHTGDWDWLLRALRKSPFLFYDRPLSSLRSDSKQTSARHLAVGIDVAETYNVLAEQLALWPNDCPPRLRWRITSQYAKRTLRRSVGAAVQRRPAYAWWLMRQATRFAILPLRSDLTLPDHPT
jgi:glycosyltransferase involved in cell wall biosynthesis